MPTFGDRVRKARRSARLTGAQLAEGLGVSKGLVSLWENNRNVPSFELLGPLSRKLRVSLDYLVLGVAGTVSPEALEVARQFDQLDPTEQQRFHAALALVRGSTEFPTPEPFGSPVRKH